MTTMELTAITLRLDLLSAAVTAMAGVLPRERAGEVALAIQAHLRLQLNDAVLPEVADEQLVADLVPLLDALAAKAGNAGIDIERPFGHAYADARTSAGRARMPARTFMGGVRPFRRTSGRRPAS